VLTGGASQLPGMRDLAADILDKQVRIGRPIHADGLAEATGGPAYAVCAGLISYALQSEAAMPPEARPHDTHASLVDRVGSWLREHF
jgi:cell division protein FtsA